MGLPGASGQHVDFQQAGDCVHAVEDAERQADVDDGCPEGVAVEVHLHLVAEVRAGPEGRHDPQLRDRGRVRTWLDGATLVGFAGGPSPLVWWTARPRCCCMGTSLQLALPRPRATLRLHFLPQWGALLVGWREGEEASGDDMKTGRKFSND